MAFSTHHFVSSHFFNENNIRLSPRAIRSDPAHDDVTIEYLNPRDVKLLDVLLSDLADEPDSDVSELESFKREYALTSKRSLESNRVRNMSTLRRIIRQLSSTSLNAQPAGARKRSAESDSSADDVAVSRRNHEMLMDYWRHVESGKTKGKVNNMWRK